MSKDVEMVIKNSRIDESKLPDAMRIIERAADIMEEWNCDTDSEMEEELIALQKELRELTGKEDYNIGEIMKYLFSKNDTGKIVYASVDEVMERIQKGKTLE